MWVRTPAHIEAHFLVCYVALAIARIMQLVTGFRHSARAMLDDLAAVSCTNAEGNWWLFDHRTGLTDELCRMAGVDLTRQNMPARISGGCSRRQSCRFPVNRKM